MSGWLAATVAMLRGWRQAWVAFWFSPRDAATLGLIRILAGGMLFYTHLVWGLHLTEFVGPSGRLSAEHTRLLQSSPQYPEGTPYAWSHLYWLEDSAWLGVSHVAVLLVFAALTLGLFTRFSSLLAALMTISYSHRLASAQFGLDQINAMLALYLAVGRSGDAWSLDAWWRARRGLATPQAASVRTNIATRLMQIHLCIIYLFAGAGKLLGPTWWEGTALWGAIANQEYQTLDLTWLASHVLIVNLLTQVTVAWELSYCFLVWRPGLRPWILALAVPLHLGIGVAMGMLTFGLVMIWANMAFVEPERVRWLVERVTGRGGGDLQSGAAAPRRREVSVG